jgi:hypothetical protein
MLTPWASPRPARHSVAAAVLRRCGRYELNRSAPAEQIAQEVDAILAADEITSGKLKRAKQNNGLIADDEIPF